MALAAQLRGCLLRVEAQLRPQTARGIVTHYKGQLDINYSPKRRQQTQEKKNRVWQHPHPYRIPANFKVVPPQDPQVNRKFTKQYKEKAAAVWSDQSEDHPLSEDPVHDHYPQHLPDGAVRYYGFDYYPMDPDNMESIPEEHISKLFMLTMTTKFQRIPWFYARILEEFGFEKMGKTNQVVVCKNTPCNNRKLYNVKHLIEVLPVRLPEDLPLDADPKHCFLTDDGEFVYRPELEVSEARMQEAPYISDRTLDYQTINKEGKTRWRHPWEMRQ